MSGLLYSHTDMLKPSQNSAENPAMPLPENGDTTKAADAKEFSWPFKELKDNDFCDYKHFIKQLADDPEVVIRRENYFYDDNREKSRTQVPLKKKIEYHEEARRKLMELREKYGAQIPRFEYVVGHDDEHDAPALYTVTEKIHGNDLESSLGEMNGKREKEKLEALFLSLIAYARDIYGHGGKFFWDIFHAGQYKYGARRDEEEKHIYLVDIEPWMAEHGKRGENTRNSKKFYVAMSQLCAFISSAENETGAKFETAREKFIEFMNDISPEDPDYEDYRNLRPYFGSTN